MNKAVCIVRKTLSAYRSPLEQLLERPRSSQCYRGEDLEGQSSPYAHDPDGRIALKSCAIEYGPASYSPDGEILKDQENEK